VLILTACVANGKINDNYAVSTLSPPNRVGNGSIFLGCPFAVFVCSFIRTHLLPPFLMNGLSNVDKTYREFSVAPTDDLTRFWRSKVRSYQSIAVAEASTSTLVEGHLLVLSIVIIITYLCCAYFIAFHRLVQK